MLALNGKFVSHVNIALAVGLFLPVGATASVDLGIKDDQTYKRPVSWSKNLSPRPSGDLLLAEDGRVSASRPGVSIAWRNANQVEEVEVGLQNLGDEPGEGRVFVDILDETGKVLLHLEPPDGQNTVRLPAANLGACPGIQIAATKDRLAA